MKNTLKEPFLKDKEVLMFCIILFIAQVTADILIHFSTI
jgi:hypothetical protein